MAGRRQGASFGDELKLALKSAGKNQAQLAADLHVDPGQVSRWARAKALPHIDTVVRMERILDTNLRDAFAEKAPAYELFVSAPITGLDSDEIERHQADVAKVVQAVRQQPINGVYWPGEDISSMDDLSPSDFATETNLEIFAECEALLYLQFGEVIRPSGALIELGLALGRKRKTTILIKAGLPVPFMLQDGIQGVAWSSPILPQARLYRPRDVDDAIRTLTSNERTRTLLGLD